MAKLKGYLVGAHAENKIRARLTNSLKHNFEGEQLHGNRKPDFSIHDDAGDRVAFVESKARMKGKGHANDHDFQQTLENIDNTRQMTSSKQFHVVAPGGKSFFKPAQQAAIQQRAGKDVHVRFWDPSKLPQMVKELKRLVKGANKNYSSNDSEGSPRAPAAAKIKSQSASSQTAAERLRVNPGKQKAPAKPQSTTPNTAKVEARNLRVNPPGGPKNTARPGARPSPGTKVNAKPAPNPTVTNQAKVSVTPTNKLASPAKPGSGTSSPSVSHHESHA